MKKLNNFIKSRAFIITLSLLFIALIIAGVTYAWFTWTSTNNTNITMQIGEYTTVTYTGGNAINVNNLAPVYNYIDGESTTFTLTNNNTDVTKEFKYNVYLDITSISNELKTTQFKYVLSDGSSNIIDQGDFSTASNNSTLTITENKSLPNGNSSYTFLLYIDGNETNNSNMMNKTLTGSLRVTVVRGNAPTPISDFMYILGSEITEIERLTLNLEPYCSYNDCELDEYLVDIDLPVSSITIEESDVLLTSYIGGNSSVVVPNTYTIGNNTYNVKLLSNTEYIMITDEDTGDEYEYDAGYGVFMYNPIVESISVGDSVEYLSFDSIHTQRYLTTMMDNTFFNCTSLVTAPTIPNSVTNMNGTFAGCTSLVNAPIIPSSVTNMTYTFSGCTNLTGTIRINSSNVSLTNNTFSSTAKNITLEVPSGSTTYNSFNGNVPGNVTISPFTPE